MIFENGEDASEWRGEGRKVENITDDDIDNGGDGKMSNEQKKNLGKSWPAGASPGLSGLSMFVWDIHQLLDVLNSVTVRIPLFCQNYQFIE